MMSPRFSTVCTQHMAYAMLSCRDMSGIVDQMAGATEKLNPTPTMPNTGFHGVRLSTSRLQTCSNDPAATVACAQFAISVSADAALNPPARQASWHQ